MRVQLARLSVVLLAVAMPADAAPPTAKADAAKFDTAVMAGHATILALAGRTPVLKATTVGCTSHLKTAKDDFEIDWSSSSINGALTKGATLMISEGPTQDFAVDFAVRSQIAIARAAGERLSQSCGG
ncbi:hypothetical protein [Flavisphingomonas formosensis]|uniref:hypothetical protein n=1 Tax=Flavisphingomonas formosensis TaxID=861534 RepID=UPI0012FBBBAF|nr:hypothetical protein [Sphingomonas formosensis]